MIWAAHAPRATRFGIPHAVDVAGPALRDLTGRYVEHRNGRMHDMSRRASAPSPEAAWLDSGQQRAWLAYIRVQLRLTYEMNRQLQADSGLSLPDYDVLTALTNTPDKRLPLSVLAAQIGWEQSRASHHIRRMEIRGLVSRVPSTSDGRVTDVLLTNDGQLEIDAAAPGHLALVRRLFFADLPEDLLGSLTAALEQIYATVLEQGTLPHPMP